MKLKKSNIILIILLVVLLFFQAVTQINILPITLFALILGLGAESPVSFFVYPFIAMFSKFFFIFFRRKKSDTFTYKTDNFFVFLKELFIWIISFVTTLMLVAILISVGVVPNHNPPLFEVMLNIYVAIYLIIFLIKNKE